jgi:hypothetical protein
MHNEGILSGPLITMAWHFHRFQMEERVKGKAILVTGREGP